MKKHIFIISFLILFTSNIAKGVDFYPELGLDPFYSSLNPETKIGDDTLKKNDTIVDMIKNKDENNPTLKSRFLNIFKKSNESVDSKLDINDDSSFTEKKELITKKQKEKKQLTAAQKAEAATKEEKEKEKALKKHQEETLSFKDRFFIWGNKKNNVSTDKVSANSGIELTADYMEYFPERYEVEAIGNARVSFREGNTVLSANKIVFNYDRNIVKANENVSIVTKDAITEGDFVRIDLTKPDGWIENPITSTEDIKLSAKEATLYSDRIEEYDGVAKILKKETLRFGSQSFDGYVDQGQVFQKRFQSDVVDKSGVYKLKAHTIYIDSKKDHEVITLKNADLYFKNHKIASIPSTKIISNKDNTNMETNFPEFGSQSKLGMHIGPAVVLNVPGGSTLKLAPLLTYASNELGIGALARYRSQYNMTEAAYGASKEEFVLRGRHKLAPGLMLNYSRYANQNEWFLGYRMPKYGLNLNYSRNDDVKDLKLRFSQMYSAGVFVDNNGYSSQDFRDAEGRFRWMTQTYKPIYSYENEEGDISLNLGLVAQTMATVYTTGDVNGLFRIGPSLRTKLGPWQQSLAYYQAGIAGQSPFEFDRYRYGRSNFVLIESLKVCKYLSLGYLASLSMNRDISEDDLFQENRFLVSVGPDYAKFTIGYDARRRNTMMLFSMLVGTENSDIEFKKTVIKNPQNLGKQNVKKKTKKNYKKIAKQNLKKSN